MKYNYFPAVLTTFAVIISSLCAGSITGTIKYAGKIPSFKAIKMSADPVCLAKHTTKQYPQTLVLGSGNTMANIYVSIKSGLPAGKKYTAPATPVVLNQKGCKYSPHVIGLMPNQQLKILNPDGTLHNVHVIPKKNTEFNMAMPKFRKVAIKTFTKPEAPFPVKCDVHPWMAAWIVVSANPYFNITKKDGKFKINKLPAGSYEVEVWHEKLGKKSKKITVKKEGTVVANFTMSRPVKK